MTGRTFWILTTIILLAGSVLRCAAAAGDFWLDEIWTHYMTVQEFKFSIPRVFQIAHDNNHLLNSVWFCLSGPDASPLWLRSPSLVGSILLITIAGLGILGRKCEERLLAMALVAFSLPLVVLGTEARGYSLAMVFSLGGWIAARRAWQSRSLLVGFGASVALTLAVLSHFTALFVLLASGGAFCVSAALERQGIQQRISLLAALYFLPALTSIAVCLMFLRHLTIGGGDAFSYVQVFSDWAGYVMGLRWIGFPALSVWLALAALFAGMVLLVEENRWLDITFFGILFLVPVGYVLASPPKYLHLRYFAVLIPFACLLIAHVLARGLNGAWKFAALGVVATLLLAQLVSVSLWLRDGRGHYAEAMEDLLDRAGPEKIVVAGDHDYRNNLTVAYYAEALGADDRVVYAEAGKAGGGKVADWYFVHDFRCPPVVSGKVGDGHGNIFRLEKTYRYGGISGWNWSLYRREP